MQAWNIQVTEPPNFVYPMPKPSEKLKAVLTLGRISNLPTVWTNIFAGMMLSMYGQGIPLFQLPIHDTATHPIDITQYLWMLVGASLVYVSGTTLNDAFDVTYDREHNPGRPIPSGIMKVWEVWALGFIEMAAGAHILFHFANVQILYLILLCGAILAYDAVHKKWGGSVWIMGSCRFFLWLAAASAVLGGHGLDTGISGTAEIPNLVYVWSLALLLYIAGITYVARGEATGKLPSFPWPFFLLFCPVFLGFFFCLHSGQWLVLPIVMALAWGIRAGVVHAKRKGPNIGKGVALWLALITVADAMAVALVDPLLGYLLLLGFPLCLFTQKYFAAT